jgi:methyltransferase (TIGR00027 family)
MSEGKLTAENVCWSRAYCALERDAAVRNPDYMAKFLLGRFSRRMLLPGLRTLMLWGYESKVPGVHYYVQGRTRHFDGVLEAALEEPQPAQLVILGAGLDSRCYRFAHKLKRVRCFEVDHPGTAAWKRKRLARWGGAHDHVHFVSVDFNTESLSDRLVANGFDFAARTIWLWEGVTMYLPEAAVRATLEVIARTAAGSLLVFDYAIADALEHPERYYGAARTLAQVAQQDEPILFGLDPSRLATFLDGFGFELRGDLQPAALARRYLLKSDGHSLGRPAEFFAIADAVRRADPIAPPAA